MGGYEFNWRCEELTSLAQEGARLAISFHGYSDYEVKDQVINTWRGPTHDQWYKELCHLCHPKPIFDAWTLVGYGT